MAAQSAALPAPITSTSGRCCDNSMEFMTSLRVALRVGAPRRLERLDALRAGRDHGRRARRRRRPALERAAQPQQRLRSSASSRAQRCAQSRNLASSVPAGSGWSRSRPSGASTKCSNASPRGRGHPHPGVEVLVGLARRHHVGLGVDLRGQRSRGAGSRTASSEKCSRLTMPCISARASTYWTLNLPSRPLCGSGRLVCWSRRGWVQDSIRATRSGARSCVGAQMQHGVDRRMGRAAAGVALEGDARLGEVEGLRPFGQDAVGIERAGAVEDREEALLVLERAVVGGHAFLRQQRREQTVARRVPDMERLGHGAEIGLDARRHRGRERERRRHLVGRRAAADGRRPPRCRRCRASRSGASPSRSDGNCTARASLHLAFDAGRIGGDERPPGDAGRERPQRRQDRRRRMAAERVAAVVEIERVRGDAVDQRGARARRGARCCRRSAPAPAPRSGAACARPPRSSPRGRPRASPRRCRGCLPSPSRRPRRGSDSKVTWQMRSASARRSMDVHVPAAGGRICAGL